MHHSKISEPQGRQRGQGPLRMRSCIAPGDAFSLRRRWRGGRAATDEVSFSVLLQHLRQRGQQRRRAGFGGDLVVVKIAQHRLNARFNFGG